MTTTTAIKASDFSHLTTDVHRHTWGAGTMRIVSEALAGAPVIIVCDRQTGFAHIGARLGKVVNVGMSGIGIEVFYPLSDGREGQTNYRLHDIGDTIMPMVETHAKWDAIKTHREERGAAIDLARASGEFDGCDWGAMDASVHQREWHVTYTPHTGNPAFADKWGKHTHSSVSVAAVQAHLLAVKA